MKKVHVLFLAALILVSPASFVYAISCTFSINPTSRSFDAAGGSDNITVTATPDNSSCTWTAVSGNTSWIHITASGSAHGKVGYTVDPNSGGARSDNITVADKKFTVNQAALPTTTTTVAPTTTTIAPTTTTSVDNSTTTTVAPTTTTVAPTTTTIAPTTTTSVDNSTTTTVAPTTTTVAPTTTTIAPTTTTSVDNSTTTTVVPTTTTSVSTCTYSISPTSRTHAASGGSDTIAVKVSNSSCAWEAVSNDAWITLASPDNGTDNGTVSYSVTANSGAARAGTITVTGGNTFTVNQAAPSPGTSTTTTVAPGPTTTSTIAPTTTTTATPATTTTTIKCVFAQSSANTSQTKSLRQLRDSKLDTALGIRVATIYYQNLEEIGGILQEDADLKARFRRILRGNMPVVKGLLTRGTAVMSSEDITEVHDFLLDLQAQAGVKLQQDIEVLLKGIESGWLLNWSGITIE